MLKGLIKTEDRIWFTYEDAKSAIKFFTTKVASKPKFDASQDVVSKMSALVNTDYILLRYLQRLAPEAVDDKGRYYWSCPYANFEKPEKIYDIAGWQLSIIMFLRHKRKYFDYIDRRN